MSDLWRRQLEAEMERLSRSKGEPSLRTIEETAEPDNEGIVWKSSEDRVEAPVGSPEKVPDHGEEFTPSSPLVANLASRIKNILVEIRSLTESSQGRFKDLAFGQEFHRRMTEHSDNSEVDLTCFLDYVRIKSPIRQINMTHVILEEALQKHKKKLLDKEIRIFKKQFEKDLPDASVHVEELRFILNWILEYAIHSAVPNGGLGFLTRTLEAQEGKNEIKLPQHRGTKCIEVLIVIGDYEKPSKSIGVPPKTRTGYNEGESSCILPLVDEIVQKNRGLLKLSTDGEGRLRMISLILPIERRKVVYYERALA
jgi:hypothetical protein